MKYFCGNCFPQNQTKLPTWVYWHSTISSPFQQSSLIFQCYQTQIKILKYIFSIHKFHFWQQKLSANCFLTPANCLYYHKYWMFQIRCRLLTRLLKKTKISWIIFWILVKWCLMVVFHQKTLQNNRNSLIFFPVWSSFDQY